MGDIKKGPYWTHQDALDAQKAAGKGEVEYDRHWWLVETEGQKARKKKPQEGNKEA